MVGGLGAVGVGLLLARYPGSPTHQRSGA
jgi:hypothetical protein